MFRLAILIDDVGTDQPRRAMHGGGERNHHLPHAQLRGVAAGMHRRSTAESEQHEISRIMAFLYGRFTNQIAHMRIGDAIDAARGFHFGHLERLGDFFPHGGQRLGFVELHSAAEKIILV